MMTEQTQKALAWRLRDADRTLRLFITAFLLVLTVGYTIGLLFVDHTTSGTARGLSEQFRGTPETSTATELKYAKSADEMYIFLHNHILSLSLVFFAIGIIFYFHSMRSGLLKDFLMVEPFAAIVTTFGGIWMMRFVSEYFSWLVLLSGISMVGCYVSMVMLILKELWIRK
jgi:ABC-type amino acid transport system permease subunit